MLQSLDWCELIGLLSGFFGKSGGTTGSTGFNNLLGGLLSGTSDPTTKGTGQTGTPISAAPAAIVSGLGSIFGGTTGGKGTKGLSFLSSLFGGL
jgi:hypothetical protein